MNKKEYMIDLNCWTEVTKGLYRYVIAANCCYEIQIIYHYLDTNILTAKASLYIVGDWASSEEKRDYFSRECLLSENSVQNCLEAAYEDDAKSNE